MALDPAHVDYEVGVGGLSQLCRGHFPARPVVHVIDPESVTRAIGSFFGTLRKPILSSHWAGAIEESVA
jgi:hypothetical protein